MKKNNNFLVFGKVHFLGIGGISQSGLAKWCISKNIAVSGTDITKTTVTKELEKLGATVFYEHKKENIETVLPDVVVYNGAINETNEEIVEARNKGIIIMERSRFLAEIADNYDKVIAVCGCHGKTSTVAYIYAAIKSLKPTVHDGGVILPENESLILGDDKFFVTEACEFKESFLSLSPDILVVLNIEADHMDYYKTFENVKLAYYKFALNVKENGYLILNKDDENSEHLFKMAESLRYKSKNIKILTFGLSSKSDCFAKNIKEENGYLSFKVYFKKQYIGLCQVKGIGKFHVPNILATVCCAKTCGLSSDAIFNDIAGFVGVKRRMEEIKITKIKTLETDKDNSNVKIFHDYAHHPTEIKTVIDATRKNFKNSNIYVIFEPHTYSRTFALEKEFIKCFDNANEIKILPIYAAREIPIENVTSENLSKKIKNASYINSYVEAKEYIYSKQYEKNAVILILGAGSIVNLTNLI